MFLRNGSCFKVVLDSKGTKKKLGFTIVGGVDSAKGPIGIYIKSIYSGGLANECGLLNQGDEILSINGTCLVGMKHAEALSVIKKNKSKQPLLLLIGRQTNFKMKIAINRRKSLPSSSTDSISPIQEEEFQPNIPKVSPMTHWLLKTPQNLNDPSNLKCLNPLKHNYSPRNQIKNEKVDEIILKASNSNHDETKSNNFNDFKFDAIDTSSCEQLSNLVSKATLPEAIVLESPDLLFTNLRKMADLAANQCDVNKVNQVISDENVAEQNREVIDNNINWSFSSGSSGISIPPIHEDFPVFISTSSSEETIQNSDGCERSLCDETNRQLRISLHQVSMCGNDGRNSETTDKNWSHVESESTFKSENPSEDGNNSPIKGFDGSKIQPEEDLIHDEASEKSLRSLAPETSDSCFNETDIQRSYSGRWLEEQKQSNTSSHDTDKPSFTQTGSEQTEEREFSISHFSSAITNQKVVQELSPYKLVDDCNITDGTNGLPEHVKEVENDKTFGLRGHAKELPVIFNSEELKEKNCESIDVFASKTNFLSNNLTSGWLHTRGIESHDESFHENDASPHDSVLQESNNPIDESESNSVNCEGNDDHLQEITTDVSLFSVQSDREKFHANESSEENIDDLAFTLNRDIQDEVCLSDKRAVGYFGFDDNFLIKTDSFSLNNAVPNFTLLSDLNENIQTSVTTMKENNDSKQFFTCDTFSEDISDEGISLSNFSSSANEDALNTSRNEDFCLANLGYNETYASSQNEAKMDSHKFEMCGRDVINKSTTDDDVFKFEMKPSVTDGDELRKTASSANQSGSNKTSKTTIIPTSSGIQHTTISKESNNSAPNQTSAESPSKDLKTNLESMSAHSEKPIKVFEFSQTYVVPLQQNKNYQLDSLNSYPKNHPSFDQISTRTFHKKEFHSFPLQTNQDNKLTFCFPRIISGKDGGVKEDFIPIRTYSPNRIRNSSKPGIIHLDSTRQYNIGSITSPRFEMATKNFSIFSDLQEDVHLFSRKPSSRTDLMNKYKHRYENWNPLTRTSNQQINSRLSRSVSSLNKITALTFAN